MSQSQIEATLDSKVDPVVEPAVLPSQEGTATTPNSSRQEQSEVTQLAVADDSMVSPNAVPFGKHEDNRAQEAGVTEVDASNSEVGPVKADDAAASEPVKTNGEVASSNSSAVQENGLSANSLVTLVPSTPELQTLQQVDEASLREEVTEGETAPQIQIPKGIPEGGVPVDAPATMNNEAAISAERVQAAEPSTNLDNEMKTDQTVANSSIPETGVSSGGQADPLGDSEVKIQATHDHDATVNEPPSVVQEERQIQVDVVVPSEADIAEAKLTIEADVAKILAGESAAISLTQEQLTALSSVVNSLMPNELGDLAAELNEYAPEELADVQAQWREEIERFQTTTGTSTSLEEATLVLEEAKGEVTGFLAPENTAERTLAPVTILEEPLIAPQVQIGSSKSIHRRSLNDLAFAGISAAVFAIVFIVIALLTFKKVRKSFKQEKSDHLEALL